MGRARRTFDVEAELEAHVEDALECGERVLVHAMAGSKTGLRQIDPAWIRRWCEAHPAAIRVVVDAAQCRLDTHDVRAFLDAGASVSITGSKALSGPPFCGAVLLAGPLLADAEAMLERGEQLPQGLCDTVAVADLPGALADLLPRAQPVNLGLMARWQVALDEIDRLAAVPMGDRVSFSAELVGRLRSELDALSGVRVVGGTSQSTVISFAVVDATGEPLGRAALTPISASILGVPGVYLGHPVELCPGGPGALRFAVGSSTISRALTTGVAPATAADLITDVVIDVLDQFLPQHATV